MSYCLRVVVINVPDAHSLPLYGAEFMHNSCMYVRISEFVSCYPFACSSRFISKRYAFIHHCSGLNQQHSSVLAQG